MRTSLSFIVIAACALPRVALAGGILIPGAGPQAQARAGSFVAKADDPTALAHNPAGFAKMNGTVILIGANLVDYRLRYTRLGRYEVSNEDDTIPFDNEPYPVVENIANPSPGLGDFQIIPSIAVSTDLGMPDLPLRFGIGLYAPQGYPAREFPLEHQINGAAAPGPQRYDIVRQKAATVLPSVAVAYKALPNLDIGVRLSWGFAKIEGQKVVWSVTNYAEYSGSDSLFTAEATDPFVPAAALGVLYRPTPAIEIGAAYTSPLHIRAKGIGGSEVGGGVLDDLETVPIADEYALCEKGGVAAMNGEPAKLKACLDIDIPQMVTIGARYILRDATGGERGDIELDLRWENWSAASSTSIIVDSEISIGGAAFLPLNPSQNHHGFKDVLSTRLGGSYSFPIGSSKLTVRAGVAYDTATAPNSWTRVDIDGKARTTLAGGVAFETSRFRIELGGGLVIEGDIFVDHQCQPPDGPTLPNQGCAGNDIETPFDDRDAPDPGQPLMGPKNSLESPFNAGNYESGYKLLSIGLSTWF